MTTELTVQVTASPERLDSLSMQLAQDLRAIGGLSLRPVTTHPAPGAKGPVSEVGYWIVSGLFSAATVNAIRDVVVAYLARTSARAVHLKVGDREVTLDGVSAADLADVTRRLETLLKDDQE